MACTSFLPRRALAFKEGAPRVLSRAQRAAYWNPILASAGLCWPPTYILRDSPEETLIHCVVRARSPSYGVQDLQVDSVWPSHQADWTARGLYFPRTQRNLSP